MIDFNIGNTHYTMDFEKAIAYGILKEKIHRTGNIYVASSSNTKYILAHVGENCVTLVSMYDGNLWSTAVKVNNHRNITDAEFNRITNAKSNNVVFTLDKAFQHSCD